MWVDGHAQQLKREVTILDNCCALDSCTVDPALPPTPQGTLCTKGSATWFRTRFMVAATEVAWRSRALSGIASV